MGVQGLGGLRLQLWVPYSEFSVECGRLHPFLGAKCAFDPEAAVRKDDLGDGLLGIVYIYILIYILYFGPLEARSCPLFGRRILTMARAVDLQSTDRRD